jgi:hypothetical protein
VIGSIRLTKILFKSKSICSDSSKLTKSMIEQIAVIAVSAFIGTLSSFPSNTSGIPGPAFPGAASRFHRSCFASPGTGLYHLCPRRAQESYRLVLASCFVLLFYRINHFFKLGL